MSWHISPVPVNVGTLSLERKRVTVQLQGKKHICHLLSTKTYIIKLVKIKELRWDIYIYILEQSTSGQGRPSNQAWVKFELGFHVWAICGDDQRYSLGGDC